MVAPAVSLQDPAPAATEEARSVNVFFHVGGANGVTQSTIDVQLQIDGGGFFQAVTAGVSAFPTDGPQAAVAAQGDGFDVTVDNRGVWPSASQVDVRINAESTLAEAMTQVDYSYSCATVPVNPGVLLQIAKG